MHPKTTSRTTPTLQSSFVKTEAIGSHADGAKETTPSPEGSSYATIAAAAARLSTSACALRARCRRHARREGRTVLAHLGGGIVAIKFGAMWRVRFPE